jgi:signal transduction histidine kinase/ligand-binding sensor domain-containing protein
MRPALMLIAISTAMLLVGSTPVLALDPSLDITQYAHTAWTVRDGFSLGNIYAMAQTPDGYLWLGTEFGLFRFDGVHAIQWHPPAGQQLPDKNINALLVTRDGSLWIGTFAGLVTWNGSKLIPRPAIGRQFVSSLFEDKDGTVWASTLEGHGRLCAMRPGSAKCYGDDGAFGRAVWAMYEDGSGNLWAAAQSGLWRWKPGAPRRYPTPTELVGLNKSDDGKLLIAMHGAGLVQFVNDKLKSYPIRSAGNLNRELSDREVDANRLLRDRDDGLWIGTIERGLIHVHHGRTDVFTTSDGLSGDVILSVFEDREGNVWVASTGGLDRFRELPVATVSVKQGLASDATQSLLAARDRSIWVGSHEGLTRWKNGQATIFNTANGLPDNEPHSLFEDDRGRIWVSTRHGLAYFEHGRFVLAKSVPGGEVHFITGDKAGNVWLAGHQQLLHLQDQRLVERIPWAELGHPQTAAVLLADPDQGGVWIGFWVGGGVSYLKDRQVKLSYTAADGLGEGGVTDLRFDRDGALWAATEWGGLSRIKDGHIATLTNKNGLPCNGVHWAIEDDDRSMWLYTSCGVVRIARAELDAWIADPKRTIQTTVWDAADGVRLRSSAASAYGPRVAKAIDGKVWFVTGEGVQVIDPRHLAVNRLPPPVSVEQIVADHRVYWQKLPGASVEEVRLPARTHDLQIDYTALSLVAPEKVRFKYLLEGQDQDWREVVNDREVQYSNLPPRHYRFRVIASNNSGVWNDRGDKLEFSIAPAYYQTNWFRALCLTVFLVLLWAAYQYRVRQLHHEFNMTLDARVGERTRIARELHDTLLQSFHGILLHLQTVSNELPTGHSKEKLDSVIDQAEHAIVEGRNAVQGLRITTIEGNDLAVAIRTLGEELAAAQGGLRRPNFSVQVEGTPRNLHPIVRDEIYRMAGEALRNAFRHAHAQRIEAEIHYGDRELRVRVRDDGKGIDPHHLSDEGPAGHFGLRGMRERSKLIGGKLSVWSELESGTELEFSIPGERAYAPGEQRRFSLIEKVAGKLSRKDTELKT